MQTRALSTRQRGQTIDIDAGPAVGPVNIAAPTIIGNPWIGQTLTADHGPWSGTRPMNYAYQWFGNGAAIDGAQKRTFAIPADDPDYIAAALAVQVRASNAAGSDTAMSDSVTVTVVPPVFAAYSINGPMQVGQTVYAIYTASGTAPITPSFRWFQEGIEIDGETTNNLLLTAGMLGLSTTVEITLTNDAGTAVVTTAARVVLAADPVAPMNTGAPVITGTPNPNEELSVSDGDWTGTPPITYARQWYADDVPIEGATASTYLVPDDPGQIGKMISAVITASNAVDDVPAAASAVEIVSASGAFSPLDLPGIVFMGVTSEPDGMVVVDGKVAQVTDFSPAANHLVQADPALQPEWSAGHADMAGAHAVYARPTDALSFLAPVNMGTAFTVFFAHKCYSLGAAQLFSELQYVHAGIDGSSAILEAYSQADGPPGCNRYAYVDAGQAVAAKVFTFRIDNSDSAADALRMEGIPQAVTSYGDYTPMIMDQFGGLNDWQTGIDGRFSALLIYTTALSDSEVEQVEQWLIDRLSPA